MGSKNSSPRESEKVPLTSPQIAHWREHVVLGMGGMIHRPWTKKTKKWLSMAVTFGLWTQFMNPQSFGPKFNSDEDLMCQVFIFCVNNKSPSLQGLFSLLDKGAGHCFPLENEEESPQLKPWHPLCSPALCPSRWRTSKSRSNRRITWSTISATLWKRT